MKTFKKVLASTLAAAMVVTALPVTPANAAAAPKLSTTKAAVYVGQSKTIKVTTPKTWKSVKVKATTSKKSVAKVKASKKKVTVKAVKCRPDRRRTRRARPAAQQPRCRAVQGCTAPAAADCPI